MNSRIKINNHEFITVERVELSSEELVKTTGGRIKPITDIDVIREFGAQIFAVTPEAQRRLWDAAF